MRILVLITVLSFTIFVHEFGHYAGFIWYGVPVDEFTVGFGPTLFSVTLGNGTLFSVRMLPFGGFTAPDPDAFAAFIVAHPHRYAVTAVAGMALNVITSFLCGAFAMLTWPQLIIPTRMRGSCLTWLLRVTVLAWVAAPFVIANRFLRDGPRALKGFVGPIGLLAGHEPGEAASSENDGADIGSDDGDGEDARAQAAATESIGPIDAFLHSFFIGCMQVGVAVAGVNLLPLIPFDGGFIALRYIEAWFGDRLASLWGFASFATCVTLVIGVIVVDVSRFFRKR